jgi:hypothetical protein
MIRAMLIAEFLVTDDASNRDWIYQKKKYGISRLRPSIRMRDSQRWE